MNDGISDIIMSVIFLSIFFIFSRDLTSIYKLTWMDFIFLAGLFGLIDGIWTLIFK